MAEQDEVGRVSPPAEAKAAKNTPQAAADIDAVIDGWFMEYFPNSLIARSEVIFQALFDLVKNLPGFVTTSRRARLAQDVPPEEQPALFVEEGPGETVANQGQGLPPKHVLYVDLGFYARLAEDKSVAPGSVLNPLIDAIEAALGPGPDAEDQTLGGLVEYCRINGKVLKNEGLLDGQASVVIPVEILVL